MPIAAAPALPVAAIVHACHEQRSSRRSPSWPWPVSTARALEPVLIYCAERRCEADDATCPGCRLRTEKLGIRTFDEFVARHAEITFDELGHSPARARHGNAHGARAWSISPRPGPARSTGSGRAACIRKLRHGIRRAGQTGAPPAERRRGAGRDPGAPAARRQHRHGGARHGQLRPGASCASSLRATAGRTRRRALPPPAPTSSSTARRPIPRSRRRSPASTGCAPPPPASATSPSPCSRPSRPWPRCARRLARGPALRHPVRAGAQRPGDRGGRQRRRRGDGAGQSQLRLPQPGAGRAALELRVDEAGGRRDARAGDDLRGAAAAGPADARLAAGEQGGADRPSSSTSSASSTRAAFSPRPKSAPAWCRTCARCSSRMGATEQEIRTLRGIVKALVQAQALPARNCHSYASISTERCAQWLGRHGRLPTRATKSHGRRAELRGWSMMGRCTKSRRGTCVGGGGLAGCAAGRSLAQAKELSDKSRCMLLMDYAWTPDAARSSPRRTARSSRSTRRRRARSSCPCRHGARGDPVARLSAYAQMCEPARGAARQLSAR